MPLPHGAAKTCSAKLIGRLYAGRQSPSVQKPPERRCPCKCLRLSTQAPAVCPLAPYYCHAPRCDQTLRAHDKLKQCIMAGAPGRPQSQTSLCSTWRRMLGRAHAQRPIDQPQLLALLDDLGCLPNKFVIAQRHAAVPVQHTMWLGADAGKVVDQSALAGHDIEHLFPALQLHAHIAGGEHCRGVWTQVSKVLAKDP